MEYKVNLKYNKHWKEVKRKNSFLVYQIKDGRGLETIIDHSQVNTKTRSHRVKETVKDEQFIFATSRDLLA